MVVTLKRKEYHLDMHTEMVEWKAEGMQDKKDAMLKYYATWKKHEELSLLLYVSKHTNFIIYIIKATYPLYWHMILQISVISLLSFCLSNSNTF